MEKNVRRKLKPTELRGREIYQYKNMTIYSKFFMKNYGYLITQYDADDYYSYSLRGLESVVGFVLLLLISKRVLFSLVCALGAYIVLSLLFYLRFVRRLEKIEFPKEKKDNYIVSTAKEMSKGRILAIALLTLLFSVSITYYGYTTYKGSYLILFVLFGIVAAIFSLVNFASLIYKTVKKL